MQTLETAGVQVNLQSKGQESLKLLGQLPALQTQQATQSRLRMASLLLVGILASLVSLSYGLALLFL